MPSSLQVPSMPSARGVLSLHPKAASQERFLGRAIGLVGIPVDIVSDASGLRHRLRQIADCQIPARAQIEELQLLWTRLPVLECNEADFAQIIHMREFPQRRARSPAGRARCAGLRSFTEAADQRWQHTGVGGVQVIARTIYFVEHWLQAQEVEDGAGLEQEHFGV